MLHFLLTGTCFPSPRSDVPLGVFCNLGSQPSLQTSLQTYSAPSSQRPLQASSAPLGAPRQSPPALPAQLAGPPLSCLPHPVTHPHANLIGGEARAAHAHRLWIKDVDLQEVTWRPISVGQVLWLRVKAPSVSDSSVRHLFEGETGTREGGGGHRPEAGARTAPPACKITSQPTDCSTAHARAHARRTHVRARTSPGPRAATE